jgi:hypothetical protein
MDPSIGPIASRLERRLRWQSGWITAALGIGLPLCFLGIVLGLTSVGVGLPSGSWKFITRGIAWIAMSALIAIGLVSLVPVQSWRTTGALSEMIDLAIDRARRALSLIRAGLFACVVAAIFWLVRMRLPTVFDKPPRILPVDALEVIALVLLILLFCGRRLRIELRKYRSLREWELSQRSQSP